MKLASEILPDEGCGYFHFSIYREERFGDRIVMWDGVPGGIAPVDSSPLEGHGMGIGLNGIRVSLPLPDGERVGLREGG